MRVLITGANGFIGTALSNCLKLIGYKTVRCVRSGNDLDFIATGDIGPTTEWKKILKECDAIIHLAAHVHVKKDFRKIPDNQFYLVNTDGTANLARQAAIAGIRRFIFVSSLKVNGEQTKLGEPFKADDTPRPYDDYAISKCRAEQLLQRIAFETGMEVVIIRPPLVYGPEVKANFRSMMRLLAHGIPLPLAAITENRRSLVAVDNLVDLIVTCLRNPAAANQTFLVSDGEDLSTADLLRRIGDALGYSTRLFYIPPPALKLSAMVVNRPDVYQRLCGSLQADITKTRELLNWNPPLAINEALRRLT